MNSQLSPQRCPRVQTPESPRVSAALTFVTVAVALVSVRFDSASAQAYPVPAAIPEAAGVVPDPLAQSSSSQNPGATPVDAPTAIQQRGIIIVGGSVANGNSGSAPAPSPTSFPPVPPQGVQSPSQASPPVTRQPLQWQIGQAQPSQVVPQQRSISASSAISAPASAAPQPGSLFGTPPASSPDSKPFLSGSSPQQHAAISRRAYGDAVGTKGRAAKSPAVIASSRRTSLAPQRTALLMKEARALQEQNALAQSLRVHKGAVATTAESIGQPSALPGMGTGSSGVPTAASPVQTVQAWRAVAASASILAPQAPGNSRAALETSALKPQAPAVPRASIRPQSVNKPPGLWFVNNKVSGYVMTPGGYVTILGRAFGDTLGQVWLYLDRTPGTFRLPVMDWHDDEIYVLLPAGIRGYPDQPATLLVTTSSGTQYRLDEGSFHATREEIRLTANLNRLVRMTSTSSWAAPPTMSSDGQVVREVRGAREAGESINCPAPGTDDLYFLPPTGWEVTGIDYWFGRTDSGDGDAMGLDGDRVFTPGYSVGDWSRVPLSVSLRTEAIVDMIPVNWGVWRSHTNPNSDVRPYYLDDCQSNYQIAVSLIGPAGVNPF